jgi:drug/metabolite transporter (DMT)-like permease
MKLVIVLLGVLLMVVGLIRESRIFYSDLVAAGLFVFCLGGASYFFTWPFARDEEQKRRFNPDFVWFSIYLIVLVTSACWLWLLMR